MMGEGRDCGDDIQLESQYSTRVSVEWGVKGPSTVRWLTPTPIPQHWDQHNLGLCDIGILR